MFVSICTNLWIASVVSCAAVWVVLYLWLLPFVMQVSLLSLAAFACGTVLVAVARLTAKSVEERWDRILEWPGISQVAPDDPRRGTVVELFNQRCKESAGMYPFRLEVKDVFEVAGAAHAEAFRQAQLELTCPEEPRVETLFHGTSRSAAKAIVAGGFRLPKYAGMFGKGVYFAATPLKSWQYSSKNASKYMLVCDVAMGRSKVMKTAANWFELKNLRAEGWWDRLVGNVDCDSVVALARSEGGVLNVAEYVVYRPNQAVPRFVVEVGESRGPPK